MNDKAFNFFFNSIFAIAIGGFILWVGVLIFIAFHPHEMATAAGSLGHDFWQALQGTETK